MDHLIQFLIIAGSLLGVAFFFLVLGFWMGRKTLVPIPPEKPKTFDPGPAKPESLENDPFHQAIYGPSVPTIKGEG